MAALAPDERDHAAVKTPAPEAADNIAIPSGEVVFAPVNSMHARPAITHDAAIESFFATLKAEYFYLETIDGLDELEAGVHDYIDYYNRKRIKLGLKGLSPVEYRLRNIA